VEQAPSAETPLASPASNGRSVFIEDAMLMLGVCRRTVYYRIREGRLRTIRTRGGSQRVLLDSIRDLVDSQAAAATRPASSGAPAGLTS